MKKFYDFSLANAIILILAYGFTFTLSFYILFSDEVISIGAIIFNSLLVLSFVLIFIYYVLFPVTFKNNELKHFNRKIPLEHLFWIIRPNYRLRYEEIIFRDKRVPYDELSKKEVKKNEIRVQYFPKYESFLEENVGPCSND